MSFFTAVAGQPLPAADFNSAVRDQVITQCTSSTRPASPVEGQHIYETDTNLTYCYDGSGWVNVSNVGAWKSYTPTFSGTIGNGTRTGSYVRYGRLIIFQAAIVWGSTTSHGASTQTLSIPVTAAAQGGLGSVVVDQGGTGRRLHIAFASTTAVTGSTENAGLITNTAPVTTWTTGHSWVAYGAYEAAS